MKIPLKKILLYSALVLLGLVIVFLVCRLMLNLSAVGHALSSMVGALRSIVLGCVMAYLLYPLTRFAEQFLLFHHVKPKSARTLSTAFSTIVLLTLIFLFAYFIIPQMVVNLPPLIQGLPEMIQSFSKNLSDFLAQSLLPTTDLVMDRQEKKKQVKFFTNPELCDITEDLVLTEPYLAQPMNPRNKNIVTPGNEDFVRARLYEDEALHGEVAALRNGFMNNAQALIHGDLHSGSIFANEQGIKVIDPEFAFYGPMGYDIGNVIGNLFFAWANKAYTGGSAETQTALEQTIRETCDKTAEKLAAEYDKLVKFPLYRAPAFRKAYLDGVMADAYGYAGTEIIRRVVGDSKVMEVTSVTDPAQRLPMERALIKLGIYLIKNRACGLTGAAVTEKFREILSEGRESYGQNG